MAEYAISLASNVDTFERVRQAISGLVAPVGGLQSRSGIFDRGGVVTLAGGMGVSVSAFRGYVDGTSSATQAGYLVVLDAAKALIFADGGASSRTDLIVARVRDNTYDASGATSFTVEIVQGVGGGGVPATPANSLKLAEKVITAGMSAGSGGLGTAPIDKRPPRLVAAGGVIPIADATDRATLPAWAGLAIFRLDTLRVEVFDGASWQIVPFVDDTGWGAINSYANGWAARSGESPAWRRLNGVVYLRGLIDGGTTTDNILLFTLPAGYRPAVDLLTNPAIQGIGSGVNTFKLTIRANGRVEPIALPAVSGLSLNGIAFPIG